MTGIDSNVEIPSNFSQDVNVGFPPQRKLLQKVASLLVVSVISPAEQDWPVLGLNFSVE